MKIHRKKITLFWVKLRGSKMGKNVKGHHHICRCGLFEWRRDRRIKIESYGNVFNSFPTKKHPLPIHLANSPFISIGPNSPITIGAPKQGWREAVDVECRCVEKWWQQPNGPKGVENLNKSMDGKWKGKIWRK